MSQSTIAQRLQNLRDMMRKAGVDYYYVPSADPHQSEYPPECWERRQWVSGFTGSAGSVLVGLDQAYLWTDSRYFLQAETELDKTCYQLMKQEQGRLSSMVEWLKQNGKGKVCALDPHVVTLNQFRTLEVALKSVGGKLISVENNFIDAIWQDQPTLPAAPIKLQPQELVGFSAQEKIVQVRERLIEYQCNAHIVSSLDAVVWLLNIRGNDVLYNPLVVSYVIIDTDTTTLFVDQKKLTDGVRVELESQKISIADYDKVSPYLSQLKGRVLLDPDNTSPWLFSQLTNATVVENASPIHLLKACKNAVELQGAKDAHRRDGIALAKFMYWLEQQGKAGLNEFEVSKKLRALRAQDKQFLGDSFATICGFGDRGAIVHYHAEAQTAMTIDDSNMLLLDSGGQYNNGTTDVTRMFHLGQPSTNQKHHYTLVLKGHLALRHITFPHGTRGEHLDVLARQFLWQHGLDYGHGTGHGVGVYLCVHEGPQRISPGISSEPLLPGMLTSNEPGVYFEGQYGIRVENVCAVTEVLAQSKSATGHGPFYQLEDLTLAPYNRKLIDRSLLTSQEIEWVDAYHRKVLQAIHDDLPKDVQAWLSAATKPL